MVEYKKLKWTQDNFPFYYEGNNPSKFSSLNTEIYNEKFSDLIDNDEILCYNYNILKNKWDWLDKNRITFEYLINNELYVIKNEIQKAIDVLDFFNWYLERTGNCYINIVDKTVLQYLNEKDTVIFVEENGKIIGVLLPDGTLAPYDKKYGTPQTNPNSIVITKNGDSLNYNFCGPEVDLERQEYDFC